MQMDMQDFRLIARPLASFVVAVNTYGIKIMRFAAETIKQIIMKIWPYPPARYRLWRLLSLCCAVTFETGCPAKM